MVMLSLVLLVAFSPSTTPKNIPSDWKSYSNGDFGFTLRYSKDFTVCERGLDYCEVTSGSYIAVCDDTAVSCFVYTGKEYEGTNFSSAALSVNVLRDKRTGQDCSEMDMDSNPIKTKTINGVLFHYGIAGEAAAGHWANRARYRAFYDGVCFELAANTSGANIANFDPGTIKAFDGAKLDKEFDAILNTFRFTGPVVDGPAWRVYHDEDGGGTFEYPDRDTVVKSIEYSPQRQASNEITGSVFFSDNGLSYFVVTKVDLKDKASLDAWLRSSGYPDLGKARELGHSDLYTEYEAGNYRYVYGQTVLYILGASDPQHNVIGPPDNAVFRHFLHSFKPN